MRRRRQPAHRALLSLETARRRLAGAGRKARASAEAARERLSDAGLAGKGLALFRGDLHELEAAVEIVTSVLHPAAGLSFRVLARPHDAFAREAALGTAFAASRFVDLGGEEAS